MNEIELTAALEGERIFYPLTVLDPRITSISWSAEAGGEAVTEIKYGKRYYVNVETREASSTYPDRIR
ncbi:MAG: hypothetical protein LIO77_03705 [Rikenellaceae bacterium]|nr:hypothetical protein [Rikenellaceae bacterium]